MCGLAAVREERRGGTIDIFWRILILAGVVVGLGGVYWAYHL
jgi:hypothetical protein